MATVRVTDTQWRFNHGATPRGFGSWCFSADRDLVMGDEPSEPEQVGAHTVRVGRRHVWVHMATFGQARRVATTVARRQGWSELHVQP